MSGMPIVSCPVCNAQTPLDALLGHQGARDALLALAGLHASQRLQLSALRYVGLFAPAKQTMRLDRVADLLAELRTLMAPGTVQHKGKTYAAPVDYWINAMDDMLARRAELTLPMTGHKYLIAIVAGYSERSDAMSERARQQSAAGTTPPVGYAAPPPIEKPQEQPRKQGIPTEVAAFLDGFGSKKIPRRAHE